MQITATAEDYKAGPAGTPAIARAWWEHPTLLLGLVLIAAAPLLLPQLPPLVDLPGHVSHYHIERMLPRSPDLQRYYGYEWAFIGNLGVDLIVIPLAALVGVELATKLVAILIPMVTIAGFLALARTIHGRIPPTVFFALPLAYAFPFQFGFLNYSLSVGICFLLVALWMRLGRTEQIRLRAALFVPFSCALWVCHTYGWGLLGVFAFSSEVSARREKGASWGTSALGAAFACTPLTLPFLFMLLWQSGSGIEGDTGHFFAFGDKLVWLMCILREQWQAWDMASAALLLGITLVAVRGRDLKLAPVMHVAVPLLALLYLLMPRILIGSGYADMRLAPVMVAAAIIGIVPLQSARAARVMAIGGILFFAARLTVTGFTFVSIDTVWQDQLAATKHIERGSRVLTLTQLPCPTIWASNRTDHVNSLAVVRRDVFTNAQWAVSGAQMLKVHHKGAGPFDTDPSHLMRAPDCAIEAGTMEKAVAAAPGGFDYLWLLDVPPERWPVNPSLAPIWQGKNGILYKVSSDQPGD